MGFLIKIDQLLIKDYNKVIIKVEFLQLIIKTSMNLKIIWEWIQLVNMMQIVGIIMEINMEMEEFN